MFDVIIVGGGPAGLSCALILGRCRRKVLVFDTGYQRNRSSEALRGFLSSDGYPPRMFLNRAREELAAYGITIREEHVDKAEKTSTGFRVLNEKGDVFYSRKLLLSTGVTDRLPPLKGIRRYYGKSVFHCPYCDGLEVCDRPLAVYAERRRGATELCLTLKTWSNDITLFAKTIKGFGRSDAEYLERNGVKVLFEAIEELEGEKGRLRHIVTQSGHKIPAVALFFNTGYVQHSNLAHQFHCTIGPRGSIKCNRFQETDVAGLYVAGDMARDMKLAIVAAAEGAKAGVVINTVLNKENRCR